MKICIDARFLTHPQVGGFKTYTQNLVRALVELDRVNQYILYIDRWTEGATLFSAPNVEFRVVRGGVPGLEMPLREQFSLRRAIDRDRPDLVHFLCNTAPVALQVPFVLTLHDTIQVTIPNSFRMTPSLSAQKAWAITAYSKWSILKTIRTADRIITVSNYEREVIAFQLDFPSESICVTHLAPDLVFRTGSADERLAWRRELQRSLGLPTRYLMGVGYEPRKNIPLLIESFSRLATLHPTLDLVIVAAQEQRKHEFQEIAERLDLSDRVLILGSQPPSRLMQIYNLAELFVYPSERESFGLPPLEALACGAPTIAMKRSSLPEILGNGAMLVDSDDASVWAREISSILNDQAQMAALTARGLRRAAEMTWRHCAQATRDVYDEVLGRNEPVLRKTAITG